MRGVRHAVVAVDTPLGRVVVTLHISTGPPVALPPEAPPHGRIYRLRKWGPRDTK